MLSHPSVEVLGHRADVADLMRGADVFVLPSVEEGSALVTSEARGCGSVLLVSNAAGAVCSHGVDSLVHRAGDWRTLASQISALHDDRTLLLRLRAASLGTVHEITWRAAGVKLLRTYRDVLEARA
jgi:glycosyltransferase involved in cell wall biosynthesis